MRKVSCSHLFIAKPTPFYREALPRQDCADLTTPSSMRYPACKYKEKVMQFTKY